MIALDFIKEVELFYSMDKHDAKKCNEAIKELEELENRSCDNCEYWFYKTLETNIETCNFGLISHDYQSDSFCCNKWKSKNEKM